MTREQKIEALAEEYADRIQHTLEAADARARSFKAGVLAGIALRDAELLERLGTFDEATAKTASSKAHDEIDDQLAIKWEFNECWKQGARWQHEQFIKAIKSPTPDGEKEGE